jgi:Protein of unknown function (DUF3592)
MGYAISLAIGIVLVLISLFFLSNSLAFIRKGSQTMATVVELEKITDGDGDTTYRAIFQYKTSKGRKLVYKQRGATSSPIWSVGEQATVCYDPNNPEKVKLLTSFGAFGVTIILLATAMPFIVIGGGYFLAKFALQSYIK